MKKMSNRKILQFRITMSFMVLAVFAGFLAAREQVVVQMRLFQGFRGNEAPVSADVVSSFSLKILAAESNLQKVERSKVEQTLKRVFNLTDTKIMADAPMKLRKEHTKTPAEVVILNGRKLLVQLGYLEGQPNRFKVEVLEDTKPPKSLLETKIQLPQSRSTALGFEDSRGAIYFLSFHRRNDMEVDENDAKEIKSIENPKLIQKVSPKYPEPAKKARIQGSVVVNATTDTEGRVIKTTVVNGHPLLALEAEKAIKQWVYEPYIENGVKKPVKFTVVVRFRLPKKTKPSTLASREVPALLKRVPPVYPKEALKKKISGKVVIEVIIDEHGYVTDASVVDGIPSLNEAAIVAVLQYRYKPYMVFNKKVPARFTVVVNFVLK